MVASWVTNTVQHFNANLGSGSRPYNALYNVNPMTPLQFRLSQMGPDGVHRQPVLLTTVNNGLPPPPVTTDTPSSRPTLPPNSITNFQPNIPGIPGGPATVLPLNKDTSALYEIKDHTLVSNDFGLSHWDMLFHPGTIITHIYDVVKGFGSYVVWNYQDFVEQFRTWNGTWTGLLEHTALIWRMFVTAVLTIGIIELSPILASLWTILGELVEVLLTIFRWATGVSMEAFHLMGVLWDDVVSIVQRLTASD